MTTRPDRRSAGAPTGSRKRSNTLTYRRVRADEVVAIQSFASVCGSEHPLRALGGYARLFQMVESNNDEERLARIEKILDGLPRTSKPVVRATGNTDAIQAAITKVAAPPAPARPWKA